LVAPGGVNSG